MQLWTTSYILSIGASSVVNWDCMENDIRFKSTMEWVAQEAF